MDQRRGPLDYNICRLKSTEMRFLGKIEEKTKWDEIPNKEYRGKLGTQLVDSIIEETLLRWYGHIKKIPKEEREKEEREKKGSSGQQIKGGRFGKAGRITKN